MGLIFLASLTVFADPDLAPCSSTRVAVAVVQARSPLAGAAPGQEGTLVLTTGDKEISGVFLGLTEDGDVIFHKTDNPRASTYKISNVKSWRKRRVDTVIIQRPDLPTTAPVRDLSSWSRYVPRPDAKPRVSLPEHAYVRKPGSKIDQNYLQNQREGQDYFDAVFATGRKLSTEEFMDMNSKMHEICSVGARASFELDALHGGIRSGNTKSESYRMAAFRFQEFARRYRTRGYQTDQIEAGIPRADEWGMNSGYQNAVKYAEAIAKHFNLGTPRREQPIDVPGVTIAKLPINFEVQGKERHFYPKGMSLDSYFREGAKHYNNLIELMALNAKKPSQLFQNRAIRELSELYHVMINGRSFRQINQSLLMNQVNGVLNRMGRPPISHAWIDHLAQRFSADEFHVLFEAHLRGELPGPTAFGIDEP